MSGYDVRHAFERIELELVESMKRNLRRHLNEELKEGFDWNMWQIEQLKTLKDYQRNNRKLFKRRFSLINDEIRSFIHENAQVAVLQEELSMLRNINANDRMFNISKILDTLKSYLARSKKEKSELIIDRSFFTINTPKMDALIKAIDHDLQKAEYAMLRRHNDQYRKIIFDAQVYANSGAGTLRQAVDMASRDYLRSGINCIQYKDGRLVNIASYAEMAVRTANRRASLIATGELRKKHGWHLVKVSQYGACSQTCLPWQGRVYVDDVYSGGTREESIKQGYPLLSEAIAGGLFHPNCKHIVTTYFPKMRNDIISEDKENPDGAKEHNMNQRMIQQKKRMASGLLDEQNVKVANDQKMTWENKDTQLTKQNPKLAMPYPDDLDIPFQKKKKSFEADYEIIDHSFTNGTYEDGIQKTARAYRLKNGCKILIPDNLVVSVQPIDIHDVAEITEAMPNEIARYIQEIEIVDYRNPQDEVIARIFGKKGFTSAAIGGDRKISFFPSKINRSLEEIENILYHESGHILEDEFYRDKGIYISESKEYLEAIKKDEKLSGKAYVSRYANNVKNYREDLADAIKKYHLNGPTFKVEFPNRYEFIKEWMQWLKKK